MSEHSAKHSGVGGHEKLDALRAAPDTVSQAPQALERDVAQVAHLSVTGSRGGPRSSRYIFLGQALNIKQAVLHASLVGLPLVAHATIHWSGTVDFDDPDGRRFAKVREGLDKDLRRRGIKGGLTAVWCRECRAHTDVVHCHLLFHLPVEFRSGAKLLQIEAALNRLVARHGGGLWGEFAVNLTIHPHADGLYLLKGGNQEVWRQFRIRKEWRESQGVILGKRCGTTENIGRALRRRWASQEEAL